MLSFSMQEIKQALTMQVPMLPYICNDALVQGETAVYLFSFGFIFFFLCYSVSTWLHKAVGFC
jgi:hypothetical protein